MSAHQLSLPLGPPPGGTLFPRVHGEETTTRATYAGDTPEQAAEGCDLDLEHLQKIEAGALDRTLLTRGRLAVGHRQPIARFFGAE